MFSVSHTGTVTALCCDSPAKWLTWSRVSIFTGTRVSHSFWGWLCVSQGSLPVIDAGSKCQGQCEEHQSSWARVAATRSGH